MICLTQNAYAKLNLTLDVCGKRADGYHDLQSVMQTVSLCDEIQIEIETGNGWALQCDVDGIPEDEHNLAWKAAKLFCESIKCDPHGLTIKIKKNIPSGAGMGGGSADAAAVLLALNRHYGSPYTVEELADLGAKVGSDVPFCTLGGTAMAEGRGEILRKLPNMPHCSLVICKPEFSVSTPVLFRKLDDAVILNRPDNAAMECALIEGNIGSIAANLANVFDPVVSEDHPEICEIKSVLAEFGALNSQMTGSGSAVFAIMPDKQTAQAVCERLRKTYPHAFTAEPI